MSGAQTHLPGEAAFLPLHRRFERHAAAAPEAVAVVDAEGSITYAELDRQASLLGRHLSRSGVGPGTLVGVCLGRSRRLVTALLGVLKAGGAYVPLDPEHPPDRLAFVLRDAQPGLVVVESDTRQRFSDPGSTRLGEYESLVAGEPVGEPPRTFPEPGPEQLLYVMYTSGSTGVPKGVLVTHRNVGRLFEVLGPRLGMGAVDVWSFIHSPAFGYSAWEIWGALLHGSRLVIVPGALRTDPSQLAGLLASQGVTVLSLTPSAFREIMLQPAFGTGKLPASLRMIALSGEPVAAADVRAWFENHGDARPTLIDTYAITETGGQVTWRQLRIPDVASGVLPRLGEVLEDTQVHLLDEHLAPVADGQPGELCVGGPGIAQGYLNRETLTAERFVRDPFRPEAEARLYRTGDRAVRRPDGTLELLGRGDDQVKVSGNRIELREVEAALRDHPGVRDAAVRLHNGAGGLPRLVAHVVAREPGTSASMSEHVGPSFRGSEFEIWPSLGKYQIYDATLYRFMTPDPVRIGAYRKAFEGLVRDRVVLDLGTGGDAVLARLCVEAGARKVYAVEVLPEAAESAARLVDRLGLQARIVVLHGDSRSVTLPEPAEVCTHGLTGNIGSSDGILPILADAERLLAPGAIQIPRRCVTWFAAGQLPPATEGEGQSWLSPLAREYLELLFLEAGRPFDCRLCVRNFPVSNLLTPRRVWEDLDLQRPGAVDREDDAVLEVERPGTFDGFVLWTRLELGDGVWMDHLEHQLGWLPVFLPVPDAGLSVTTGDRIHVQWSIRTSANQLNPDYRTKVRLVREGRPDLEFEQVTRHHETAWLSTGLHRRLFRQGVPHEFRASPTSLRRHLAARLPRHMVPTIYQFSEALPRNASGKLDRQALPDPGRERPEMSTTFVAPRTEAERRVAVVWADVLGLEAVGIDDDFLELGGDSLAAVRVVARLTEQTQGDLPLSVLFDHPTIREMTAMLDAPPGGSPAERLEHRDSTRDQEFMGRAVAEARNSLGKGWVPYAACLVLNGEIIACNSNDVERSGDPTAHAEIQAIREACRKLGRRDLTGAVIYSTCEPCPMCLSACHEARIARIVFAASREDAESRGIWTLPIPAARMIQLGNAALQLTPSVLRTPMLELLDLWRNR